MFYSIILTPIIGIFSLLFIDSQKSIKKVTLITIVITLLICTLMGILYDPQSGGQLFLTHTDSIELGSFIIGIDSISFYLLLLTTLTFPICVLASWKNIKEHKTLFIQMLLLLESFLIGVFSVTDLFWFYVFFEAVLIPLFLMVGMWGASYAKDRASFMLFLYTWSNRCR